MRKLKTALAISIMGMWGSLVPVAVGAAAPVAGPPDQGCTIGGPQLDLSGLPPGTRLFFRPVMSVQYAKPGVDAAEATYTSPQHDVRAELRDNAVYVNGAKSPVTVTERGPLGFRARIETCVYPPGAMLPPSLANIAPDVVLR
jgi:hypothetical protein